MSYIVVHYAHDLFVDFLDTSTLLEVANSGETITIRSVCPRKGNTLKSSARIERDSKVVRVIWEECELNTKNEIHLGTLELSWETQEDALAKNPTSVTWRSIDGYTGYPTAAYLHT